MWSYAGRITACLALLFPLAFLMGFPFTLGMGTLAQPQEGAVFCLGMGNQWLLFGRRLRSCPGLVGSLRSLFQYVRRSPIVPLGRSGLSAIAPSRSQQSGGLGECLQTTAWNADVGVRPEHAPQGEQMPSIR